MRNQSLDAATQLAVARRRVAQLRQALRELVDHLSATHGSWQDLLIDVDCIERRLEGAMEEIERVFLRDPGEYTRPPRSPWP